MMLTGRQQCRPVFHSANYRQATFESTFGTRLLPDNGPVPYGP